MVLAVSCNMDSTTGLFHDAGTSIKKASYTIYSVIGKTDAADTNGYFVSSNKGVFYFDSSDSEGVSVKGNSTIARNSYLVTGTKDNWTCYYYDESNSQYMTMKSDGTPEKNNTLDGTKYALKSFYFENVNNDNHVVVFENPTTKICSIFYGTKENLVSLSTPHDTDYTDVSYLGDKLFMGKKDGIVYYFTYNGSTISEGKANVNGFRSYLNGYYVSNSSKFFYKSNEDTFNDITPSNTTGKNYTKCVTYKDDTYTYFFLSGASVVYMCKDNAVTTKTCSALASTEVKAVVSVSSDHNYINIITAENGAKCINLVDAKIENTWK